VFGHAEAADGGEEGIPVDLREGVVGPLEVFHEICAQTGSAGGVEQGFPDLSRNAFAPDCDISIAVWVLYHLGVKRGQSELLGGHVVALAVELGWPIECLDLLLFVLVALDMLSLEGKPDELDGMENGGFDIEF
jgi:hypothetical protein